MTHLYLIAIHCKKRRIILTSCGYFMHISLIIHAMLVTPPKTNHNVVLHGVVYFTLVCVEDIDLITCSHSATACNYISL